MNRLQTRGSARGIRVAGMGLSALLTAFGLWAAGCGGVTGEPDVGGESHFLHGCDSDCGGGLDCVAGICTQGCIVGDSSCSDLSESATCTDQSVEPGEVAICDVACESRSDCAELGSGYRCDHGFCRFGDASGAGGSGTGNGGAGSGAGPSNGGAGSTLDDHYVTECPDIVSELDPIDVTRVSWHGDTITFDVGHGGGCAEHTYSLCYGQGFLESYPVQTGLTLLHDAHGDNCEAYLTNSVDFDLTPLAQAYTDAYGSDAGLINTSFGMYAFGNLGCEESPVGAGPRISEAFEWSDRSCSTVDDCVWAYAETSCSKGCGAVTSTTGQDQVDEQVQEVETTICGDYEDEGCPVIPVPPCVPPPALSCIEGQCMESPGG